MGGAWWARYKLTPGRGAFGMCVVRREGELGRKYSGPEGRCQGGCSTPYRHRAAPRHSPTMVLKPSSPGVDRRCHCPFKPRVPPPSPMSPPPGKRCPVEIEGEPPPNQWKGTEKTGFPNILTEPNGSKVLSFQIQSE